MSSRRTRTVRARLRGGQDEHRSNYCLLAEYNGPLIARLDIRACIDIFEADTREGAAEGAGRWVPYPHDIKMTPECAMFMASQSAWSEFMLKLPVTPGGE